MKKKINLILIIFLILGFLPYFLKYLLINQKLSFLNSIYFNSPLLINNKKNCINYDSLLENSLNSTFSVTIIDDKGNIISTYNGDQKRVPASNLKLLSSGYVLSKFNVKNKLKTSLLKTSDNNYYLIGQGDPDLSYLDIYKLLSNVTENENININIVEINSKYYWPKGWTSDDKLYEYGAPITTLAIESNHNNYDHINNLKSVLVTFLNKKYPTSIIKTKLIDPRELYYFHNAKEIYTIESNPILSLLTLSNSESHNFTAESLFKNASNTWNENEYSKLIIWLRNKGLPVNNLQFSDASGLSRNNKVTTRLIALFLEKMKYSKDFKTFQSSLSIMGMRGTLANDLKNSELSGKFFGKTGTLSNVYALSGYLYKDEKPIIISIIQNSDNPDKNKSFNLLLDIFYLNPCT